MNHGLTPHRLIRGALTGAALACVLFVALAGGLHVHGPHAGEDCEICIQFDHFGFDIPSLNHEGSLGVLDRLVVLDALPFFDRLMPGDDPARAPPVLS